jgi:hypothetical protein
MGNVRYDQKTLEHEWILKNKNEGENKPCP